MTKLILNSEWITCLSQFSKLIVGFSGGLDSTALLHVLASQTALCPQVTAVHIHHGISPNAEYWQHHCKQFCHELSIPFLSRFVEFDRSANLEEGARIARYEAFSSLVSAKDCLILGHHLDDQAETLLLQLFRGAGVDGLAAMSSFSSWELGSIARPLLSYTRQQIEHYAKIHALRWIEDESNEEAKYSRNYLRHQIMPLLIKKWPGVVGTIARTAQHCQQAKTNLDDLAFCDNQNMSFARNLLFITPLKKLSIERITNVLRVWLKKNHIQMPSAVILQRLIHEVLFARSDANPEVRWNNVSIRRYRHILYINKIDKEEGKENINAPMFVHQNSNRIKKSLLVTWLNFPSPLILEELNIKLTARKEEQGLIIPPNATLIIKFREGGERIHLHGQMKQLKKLFQEWAIPPWRRDIIPLIYINNQLAAVVGHAVSDLFYSKNSSQAWEICAAKFCIRA